MPHVPGPSLEQPPAKAPPPRHPDMIVDPACITPEDRAGQLSVRAVLVGSVIGSMLCASNAFFALQTGWVTMASLQAAVVGFGVFRVAHSSCGCRRLTMLENVVVQTTSVAASTLPLAAGFAGIIPAFELMRKEGHPGAPPELSMASLFLWAAVLSLFGVFLAVPLRRDAILVERLKFPSGTATAEVIAVLHRVAAPSPPSGTPAIGLSDASQLEQPQAGAVPAAEAAGEAAAAGSAKVSGRDAPAAEEPGMSVAEQDEASEDAAWTQRWRVLGFTMLAAAAVSVVTEFVPVLHSLPVFQWMGVPLATAVGWTITPSLSYVGQGMIMGPRTTASMLLGSVLAWAVMAPVAQAAGWSSGPVGGAEHGVKGWVTWLALAVMLGDSVVIIGSTFWRLVGSLRAKYGSRMPSAVCCRGLCGAGKAPSSTPQEGASLIPRSHSSDPASPLVRGEAGAGGAAGGVAAAVDPAVAEGTLPSSLELQVLDPAEEAGENVPTMFWVVGLALGTAACAVALSVMFNSPIYEPLVAVMLSCLVAVVAARALGETDLNPVSGVGKLSQLFFAAVAPGNVTSNIVAGAVSEAGAQQAGDLLQDLKTGHMLGASPRAQFFAQIAGSLVGVVVSVVAYKLLTLAYPVGGPELPAPTARVWLGMAELVNGQQLPPYAGLFAGLFGAAALLVSVLKAWAGRPEPGEAAWRRTLRGAMAWAPSVMAVGVGMYIAPNWVLPRCAGSLLQVVWKRTNSAGHDRLMLLAASGFVLGEGLMSIANAGLRAGGAEPWTCDGCVGELACSGCP